MEFDRQCSTERRHDPLTVMDGVNRIVSVRSGEEGRASRAESLHSAPINGTVSMYGPKTTPSFLGNYKENTRRC